MTLLLLLAVPLLAQAETIHGANSVFAAPGIGVVWGVLRAPVEDETAIVVRISNPLARYAYLRVEAVDPFSSRRRAILEGAPLGAWVDVRRPRAGFADLPRLEMLFYESEAEWRDRKPSLTVYYLGVPDTTPEFASGAALDAYLAGTHAPDR